MSFLRGMRKRRHEVGTTMALIWERMSDEDRGKPEVVAALCDAAFKEGVRYLLRKLADLAAKDQR